MRIVSQGLRAAVLLVLWGCAGGGGGGGGSGPLDVGDVKSSQWRSRIGTTVEVEGFLVLGADGTGVLLLDPDDYEQNASIPEDRYLALGSEVLGGLDPAAHFLAKVRLRGRVRATKDPSRVVLGDVFGDVSQCELEVLDDPVVLGTGRSPPSFVDVCAAGRGICGRIVDLKRTKYALLYSGGINKDKSYQRYWNDIALYHAMLTWVYGYEPENIVVVYKDGVPENGFAPVHHPATPAGLAAAFADLGARMDFTDEFFFFMTNHGGTIADMGSPAPADEDFAQDTVDECAFYYDQNTVPYDDDVAAYVNGLSFARMICVMEQCFSGGFIYDLRGPNRVIVSAANEVEVSYGGSQFDDFVMLFASALIGLHQVDGTPVDADEDNDGQTSVYEAFRWATVADTRDEHPQYEDSGDGTSTGFPTAGVTTDGAYGATVFP
jgi:hypothetical protein